MRWPGAVIGAALLVAGCARQHADVDCEALPSFEPPRHEAPPGRACGERGLGSPELWDSSPREDEYLEYAALVATDGFVAEEADYQRLVHDVGAIRRLVPELDAVPYRAPHTRIINMYVDDEAGRRMQSGEDAAWSCLTDHYPLLEARYDIVDGSDSSHVRLAFEPILAFELVEQELATLPGVTEVYAKGQFATSTAGFCYVPDGDRWHYLFNRAHGDCPSGCLYDDYYYFVTDGDGAVERRGHYVPEEGGNEPCWLSLCSPSYPYAAGD